MKKNKTIYWIAKVFISFFMLFSAYYSYTHAVDLQLLGFPDYFRIELVIAKVTGALLLLIPQVSNRIKEWIYAGFCICMVSAFVAHACNHDPASRLIFVGVDFVLVILSITYVTRVEYGDVNREINSSSLFNK